MFDHHEYEVLEAEAFLKGAKQEREKNDADNAARDSKRANYLRSQNVPDSVISVRRIRVLFVCGGGVWTEKDILYKDFTKNRALSRGKIRVNK